MKASKSRSKSISKRPFHWSRFALSAYTLLLLKMNNFLYFLPFCLSASIYTMIQLTFLSADLYHLLAFLHLIALHLIAAMTPRRVKKAKVTHPEPETEIQ